MGHNTFLKALILPNSNLDNVTFVEIGNSLKTNSTLKEFNVENNSLNATALTAFAESLRNNKGVEIARIAGHIKNENSAGGGMQFEEALAETMKQNKTILRLGVDIRNAAARDNINRYTLRNNDVKRKQRNAAAAAKAEAVSAGGA